MPEASHPVDVEPPEGQQEPLTPDPQQQEAPEVEQEAEDFKPPPGELEVLDQQDAYRAMDRADEELILDELQGRQLKVMVYSFDQAGSKLTDLSYAGVSEVVRVLNDRMGHNLRVADQAPLVEEFAEDGESFYRVMVYAEDPATGAGRWGIAVEPKRMKLRKQTANRRRQKGEQIPESDMVWDKFALTKALSKAQRNALKALLPVEMVQTLVAQFLGDPEKVKRIRAGAGGPMAELPPPLTDEKANQLRIRCRGLYEQIKAADPRMRVSFPPGQFSLLLRRSEWEHAALEEFVTHLEGLLEKAQAVEATASEA